MRREQVTTAAIALGANLGERAATIARAVELLARTPGVRVVRVSKLHETAAVGLAGSQPQPPYVNAAALIETTLTPRGLLEALLGIERLLGRDRASGVQWAPRTIDLDLLLYGDEIVEEPGLVVPHPRMQDRMFVLGPLREIAPDVRHPDMGVTIRVLHDACSARSRGLVVRPEANTDIGAVRSLLCDAFPTPAESQLVDQLRSDGDAAVALIAELNGRVVGFVCVSRVRVEGAGAGGGLAPVATTVSHRGEGVAAALVQEALHACRRRGFGFVVVLGEPAYYTRFGFAPASRWRLSSQYDAGDAFMALELRPGAIPAGGGLVRYAPAFDALGEEDA